MFIVRIKFWVYFNPLLEFICEGYIYDYQGGEGECILAEESLRL